MCILELYGSYVCTCMDLYEMQVKLYIYAYVSNCRNVPKSNLKKKKQNLYAKCYTRRIGSPRSCQTLPGDVYTECYTRRIALQDLLGDNVRRVLHSAYTRLYAECNTRGTVSPGCRNTCHMAPIRGA